MSGITVSAPATLMICGEHAVVYGYPAIVCAVEQRLTVNLQALSTEKIVIRSALADYETDLHHPVCHPQLRFIFAALAQNPPRQGLCLTVTGNINPTLGLGSSAAVSVAAIAALARFNAADESPEALHRQAMRAVLSVQKRGSGADLAAAICGAILGYRNQPQASFTPLPVPPAQLSIRYAGYKTPTADVLALLAQRAAQNPERYQHLYRTMGETTRQAIAAAAAQDWTAFYAALNRYQQHLEQLGVCDSVQAEHIRAADDAYACKISGSGLGDCIIAFAGRLPEHHSAMTIDRHGILYE